MPKYSGKPKIRCVNPVAYLEFEETTRTTGAVTKFGGQPWGLRQSDWPNSPKGGQPLEFIAQIVLEPHLFPGADNQLAYVFWDPRTMRYDDGIVVVRPAAELTDGFAEGPAVGRMVLGPRKFLFREKRRVPCEFKVRLIPGEELALDELQKILDEDDPESERLLKQRGTTIDELVTKLENAKIGGTPLFVQSDEPRAATDRLLLQLPDGRFPFHMDLGDAGTFFAFLNQDFTSGYGFWECC